jgi:predicted alpha/beta hydrolase
VTTPLTIPADDGYLLAASHFPTAGAPQAIVLLSPATGVKRSLYRRLAEYLAGQGLAAATWDWRGTGESRPASLRGFPFSMRQWGELDLTGMLNWAEARYPGIPLLVIGHSFGGQALGLARRAERITAAATVASQIGYWGLWPSPVRYLYALLWYGIMPGLTGVVGWFPSARLGLGEDLPPEVAREWSRWCRSPDYLGDWTGHGRFQAPLYVLGFTDDPFAPPRAVAALHDRYGSTSQIRRILSPREAGLKQLGHFGFFRPEAAGLWSDVVTWLKERANIQ